MASNHPPTGPGHAPVGGLLVAGDRISPSSGGTHEHIYPATGQPNATIVLAGAAEIDYAVTSAWDAHREWMSLTVDRRRDLLIDLADAVHEKFTSSDGSMSTTMRSRSPSPATAMLLERFLRHFAGYADKPHGSSTPVARVLRINLVEREPYGVVGVIAPWNGHWW